MGFIGVHIKLADVMQEVSDSISLSDNYAYVFDNELFYNQTKVSTDTWEILKSLGYTVETFDNGDGVSGRGILVEWSY